jgi:3D (Asp-Asp-Asp) domain-containing protein
MTFDPDQPFETVETSTAPAPTATPVTHYSLGTKVGGPDPYNDGTDRKPGTNQGYGATGSPILTPGIAAVDPSIYPIGSILKDADTGEVFLAADKHGNRDPNVVDIFQSPDKYQDTKTTRNFEVVGHVKDIPSDPTGVKELLSQYGKVPDGVSAKDFLDQRKSGFDPSKPFDVVKGAAPAFDPNAEFETVEAPKTGQPSAVITPPVPQRPPLTIDMNQNPELRGVQGLPAGPSPTPAGQPSAVISAPTAAPQAQGGAPEVITPTQGDPTAGGKVLPDNKNVDPAKPDLLGQVDAAVYGVSKGSAMLAGGLAAAGALEVPNAAISAWTGPFAPLTFGLLNAGEFLVGGYLAGKAHGALTEGGKMLAPDQGAGLEQNLKAHPTAEMVGETIPMAAQGVQSVRNMVQIARAQPTLQAAAKQVTMRMGGGAAAGAAFEPVRYAFDTATGKMEEVITGKEGAPVQPITVDTVAESMAWGAILSTLHKPEISRAEVQDMVTAAPTHILKQAAADPEFRKSWQYDSQWIDQELARREGRETNLPPTGDPKVDAAKEKITQMADAQYAPKPLEPEVITSPDNRQKSVTASPSIYDEAQKRIDSIEDKLESQGVDVLKLYHPDQKGAEILETSGWKKMPENLAQAYRDRDAIGKGELESNVRDITGILKSQGLNESEIARILDKYALSHTDGTGQYLAAEHTIPSLSRNPIKQAEEVAYALAADRKEMFDELRDVSDKSKLDAGNAVKALREYFGIGVKTSETTKSIEDHQPKLSHIEHTKAPTVAPKEKDSPMEAIQKTKGNGSVADGIRSTYEESFSPYLPFLRGEKIEIDPSQNRMGTVPHPDGRITINIEHPDTMVSKARSSQDIEDLGGAILKAKVQEEIHHAADVVGFRRDWETTDKSVPFDKYVQSRFTEIGADLRKTSTDREVQDIIDLYTKNKGESMNDEMLGAEFSRQVGQELSQGHTTEQVQILSEKSKAGDVQAGTLLDHLLTALANFKATVGRYLDLSKAPESLRKSVETATKILNEYSRPDLASIKNAATERGRSERGLSERTEVLRRPFEQVWDEAVKQSDSDKTRGTRLVDEMNENPRVLSDTEQAILLHETAKREQEFDSAVDAVNNAKDSFQREDASKRLAEARKNIDKAYSADEVAGTKVAQALNSRKMAVDKQTFTLARMEAVAKAEKNQGAPLSEQQLAEVKAAHDKIKKLAAEVRTLEGEVQKMKLGSYLDRLVQETISAAKASAAKGQSAEEFLQSQADRARERMKKVEYSASKDIKEVADEAIIGASILKNAPSLEGFTKELVKEFGEGIRESAEDIFNQSKKYRDAVERAHAQYKKPIQKGSLEQYTKLLKTRTKTLEERIAKGDFATPTREARQLDAKARKAAFEYEEAKRKWNQGLLDARLAQRSGARKIFDRTVETANLSRAVIASSDLSAVLRQGGFIAVGNPIRAAKSFPAMMKAFASKQGEFEVNKEIAERENFPLYKQAKLALTTEGASLSKMEEQYMSRWARHIPLVSHSERAYTTFLNKLRADSFDAMSKALTPTGKPTLEESKAIANFINAATGRADLGKFNTAGPALNTVFFAPKYVASRFQLLTGQPFYKGTTRTRKLIAKEYAKYLTGVAVIYGLSKLAGASVELDPRSSDFGKVRFGNTRVDMLSGLAQVTTLLSRTVTGQTKNAKNEVLPLRNSLRPLDQSNAKVRFGARTNMEVLTTFLRSKLAPVPGAALDTITGKNVIGQEVTPADTAKEMLVPLSFGDIYDAMKEQGIPAGAALGVLSIFGAGLSTYQPKKTP